VFETLFFEMLVFSLEFFELQCDSFEIISQIFIVFSETRVCGLEFNVEFTRFLDQSSFLSSQISHQFCVLSSFLSQHSQVIFQLFFIELI
jgi:hypothetical protein